MTVLEAIQANPVFSSLSAVYIETILGSRSINGAATYDIDSLKDVELASADLYHAVAVTSSLKEGDLSITYDTKALIDRAKALYAKYDDPRLEEFKSQVINVGISNVSDAW